MAKFPLISQYDTIHANTHPHHSPVRPVVALCCLKIICNCTWPWQRNRLQTTKTERSVLRKKCMKTETDDDQCEWKPKPRMTKVNKNRSITVLVLLCVRTWFYLGYTSK